MKTRQRFCILFMLIAGMMLFSGCTPVYTIDVSEVDFPPMTQVYALLKAEGEQLKAEREVPEKLSGSEIALYDEEGWVPAAFAVTELFESHRTDGSEVRLGYQSAVGWGTVREFCETFREIRFAIVENDGTVRSVSEPYSLVPDDRFGYPVKINFNGNTGSVEVTKYISRLIAGRTPFEWWLMLTVISWITNLAVQIMVSNSLKHEEKKLTPAVKV